MEIRGFHPNSPRDLLPSSAGSMRLYTGGDLKDSMVKIRPLKLEKLQ